MPWFVPSTTVTDGLAATEVAMPAVGAVAICIQLAPPFSDEKTSFRCPAEAPEPGEPPEPPEPPEPLDAQVRISSFAFTAPNSAPAGCPSAWAVPTGHAEVIEFTSVHGPLPLTGPAYSARLGASRKPRLRVSVRVAASCAAPSVSPEVEAPTGVQSLAELLAAAEAE